MPILYHAPFSRSSTVAALVYELDAPEIEIRQVSVTRQGGKGGPDPANPHPEKKVPFLVDGAEEVRERAAIMTYLTDAYPKAGLGPLPGEAGRGAYLSWLSYYQGVMEPLILLWFSKLSAPAFADSLRDMETMYRHLEDTLAQGPWLLGERFTAADLLCSSPFGWVPGLGEGHPVIEDWVKRCSERPSMRRVAEEDARAMAEAG
ncbi:glutathione S-transferase family protein [Pseudooceanicola sp.]|uniref:glutathione S-transferase family protein n=1 Tax=Pseudooceanicola sp. TaxID=1914328 RepID=UPI0035C7065E